MRDPQPAGPEEEGRTLVERLGGRWNANGGLCRCPAHDDRKPSLSVRPGRTRLLLHCFAGCTVEEILCALEHKQLLERSPPHLAVHPVRDEHYLSALALRIWNESRPLQGTAAERYLARRGLQGRSSELRFHPRTPHGRSPLTAYRPALIAAVRDATGLTGIHRTFLGPEAPNEGPRKSGLGRFGHGAVRLGGSGSRIGLAEGIETALSASVLFGIPCWAALGAERFAAIELPPEAAELILFLDHDSGGRRAEALARETFGRSLRITDRYPPRRGDDWNDVLQAAAGRRPMERGEEAARG